MKLLELRINHDTIIKEVSTIIRSGGIVILPFDTVYGFACNPKNESSLQKIYELKKRPAQKTIGLAVANINEIETIGEINNISKKYIIDRTPGKYTFIIKSKNNNSISNFCVQNGTIGVRIPDSKLILEIIEASGGIIAQTSANISGQSNCYSVEDIRDQYDKSTLNKIDIIVDEGKLKNSGASILINLTGQTPQVINR